MVMRFLSLGSIGRWGMGNGTDFLLPSSYFPISYFLRRAQLRGELVKHAVHELVAVGSAVALRQLDGLVDHGAIRHFRQVLELVPGEQQDAALDRGEPRVVAVQVRRDRLLELGRVRDRTGEQHPEVVDVDLLEALGLAELAADRGGVAPGDLPLVYALEGEFARA